MWILGKESDGFLYGFFLGKLSKRIVNKSEVISADDSFQQVLTLLKNLETWYQNESCLPRPGDVFLTTV